MHMTEPTDGTLWHYILQENITSAILTKDKNTFAKYLKFARTVTEGLIFLHGYDIAHGNLSIRNTMVSVILTNMF